MKTQMEEKRCVEVTRTVVLTVVSSGQRLVMNVTACLIADGFASSRYRC